MLRRHRILRTLPALALVAALAVAAGSSAAATPRITNGTKATPALFEAKLRPTVALVSLDGGNEYDGQFCGGTLIDDTHVLTAGHCFVGDEGVRTRTVAGSFGVLVGQRVLGEGRLVPSKLIPVTEIFVNPNFNIRTMRWDAAVLRLARPVTEVPVMPRLTDAESAAMGFGTATRNALVAGWGDTNPADDDCCFPQALMAVDIPVHPNTTCDANLRRAPDVKFSGEFQICGGRLTRNGRLGADTCQGDSGGPLYVDVNGTPRVAGVTSFGVGCGERFFGVYARVTALGAWLDSIPGIPAGDTRDASFGPGNVGTATVTGTATDYTEVGLQITPPATGTAPTSYTIWARDGDEDTYLQSTTSTTPTVSVRAMRTARPYTLLVRAVGPFGEGPIASTQVAPKVDAVAPSRPAGLRVTKNRRGGVTATWRPAADRQSGVYGYRVQVQRNGRWLAPETVSGRSFTYAAGSASGKVRVRTEDWADNLSAWSPAVAF